MCDKCSGGIIALLFGIALVFSACQTAVTRNEIGLESEPTAILAPTPETTVFTNGTVAFENVRFSFERDLIEKVEVSMVPAEKLEDEDIKPDGIGGRTLEFVLKYRGSDDEALISVFKIAEYMEAFARFPQYVEDRDQRLESLIKNPSKVRPWGLEEPVHVRWMDAHHDFFAKAGITQFNGGRGLLMLTQIGQDAYSLINNEQLEYFFQGLTDDGEWFVEMSFPADVNNLPKDAISDSALSDRAAEFYKYPDRYKKYASRMAREIDGAPDGWFTPDPRTIQNFLKSFRVK